jgi:hypothetical protein
MKLILPLPLPEVCRISGTVAVASVSLLIVTELGSTPKEPSFQLSCDEPG